MKNLNEINIIRAVACIFVVMTHSISNFLKNVDVDMAAGEQYIVWFRFALLCATPIFILLSVTIISKNYQSSLPKGFFLKRFKYIMIPYILIGAIVSYRASSKDFSSFLDVFYLKVVTGSWYGFFVLVIFQFYIIHWLAGRFLAKVNPIIPVLASFAITFGHIYGFVHMPEYREWIIANYPLHHRTLILGWLFYFTAAFYIGQYYEQIMEFLNTRIWLPFGATVATFGLVMYNYHELGYTRVTSDRYDMLLYAVSMYFLLAAIIRRLQIENKSLMMVSHFSFFIYLSHMIILPYFANFTLTISENFFIYVGAIAFLTISSCIGIGLMLYQNEWTKWFTGRIAYLETKSEVKKKEIIKQEADLPSTLFNTEETSSQS